MINGYNGRGIGPGTTFGKLLAQLAQGQITPDAIPLPLSKETPISLKFWRGLFYEGGARMYHLMQRRL